MLTITTIPQTTHTLVQLNPQDRPDILIYKPNVHADIAVYIPHTEVSSTIRPHSILTV